MAATLRWAAVPAPWGIEVSFPSPGTARLAVAGEIDVATAPMLATRLLTVLTDHRPVDIEVDLADVTFLDCSGIGTLVAVRNAGEQSGCRVWISHPQPTPEMVLAMVGLLGLFTAPVRPPDHEPESGDPVPLWPFRSRFARMARAMVGRRIAA